MDQCDKYGLCTPVPIQGKMNETIMSRCKIFVEDYEMKLQNIFVLIIFMNQMMILNFAKQ